MFMYDLFSTRQYTQCTDVKICSDALVRVFIMGTWGRVVIVTSYVSPDTAMSCDMMEYSIIALRF